MILLGETANILRAVEQKIAAETALTNAKTAYIIAKTCSFSPSEVPREQQNYSVSKDPFFKF
jgi:hypothetical protein